MAKLDTKAKVLKSSRGEKLSIPVLWYALINGRSSEKTEDAPQCDGEDGLYENLPDNPGSGGDFHRSNPYICTRD
jgi:hypothetical protein